MDYTVKRAMQAFKSLDHVTKDQGRLKHAASNERKRQGKGRNGCARSAAIVPLGQVGCSSKGCTSAIGTILRVMD